MSALKKVPNYVVLFLMFLLTFTRTTFARVFPALRHHAQTPAKVFTLSGQQWAALRAGADLQEAQTSGNANKDGNQQTEQKKDDAKNDSAKPADKQNQDNAKTTEPKEPAQAPDTQSPGGGDGDLGGIGG